MKNKLSFLALLFSASTVFASNDQTTLFLDCSLAKKMHDFEISTKLYSSGVHGLLEMQISKRMLGEKSVKSVWVKPHYSPQIGSPVIYSGKGISLSINSTTTPQQGGHLAILSLGKETVYTLLCKKPTP